MLIGRTPSYLSARWKIAKGLKVMGISLVVGPVESAGGAVSF
jgi:hypothetical protein